MKIIHIVRRYGSVGGMERYVWETTRELVKLGHQVQVICEYCVAEKPQGIAVHELGEMTYRPRWFYYWRFGRRVEKWLRDHPQPGWLIHSHERVSVHHITTFHSPPFASVRDQPWWKKSSLRVAMHLYMELRELRVAQRIVPNSEIISRQLAHYYPEYAHKLTQPVVPGVVPGIVREKRSVPKTGGIIGFIGSEWQRKGLPLAVEIVAQLRRQRPQLELWVIGPDESEVRHLFANRQGGYQLLGWRSDATHFHDIDVLLHPAKAEPYGMVISESMSARIPVVVSDACGAAPQVNAEAGEVVALNAPLQQWVQAVAKQLDRVDMPPEFVRGWDVVAAEYEAIYPEVIYLTRRKVAVGVLKFGEIGGVERDAKAGTRPLAGNKISHDPINEIWKYPVKAGVSLKIPHRILVIVTLRIGDVLLNTPIVRSLRLAWPQAEIDVLVFKNTEGILQRNPDIQRVITVAERPGFWAHSRLLIGLFRRYDLALTPLLGDRPTLYAWAAGKTRLGMQDGSIKEQWKRKFLTGWAKFDHIETHTVLTSLRLMDLLNVKRNHEMVVAWNSSDESTVTAKMPFNIGAEKFAVLHLSPKFVYKMWHRDGWIELSRWLEGSGIRTVLTGSSAPDEMEYVEQIFRAMPASTLNMAGKLSLAESAFLISRAKYYIGPDTALTHMAAALGTPTVALFGPSNPIKWGPWPKDYAEDRNPYRMIGIQRVNNVVLLQGDGDCVPCMEEGCERHIMSLSDCLQGLPVESVIKALQEFSPSETTIIDKPLT